MQAVNIGVPSQISQSVTPVDSANSSQDSMLLSGRSVEAVSLQTTPSTPLLVAAPLYSQPLTDRHCGIPEARGDAGPDGMPKGLETWNAVLIKLAQLDGSRCAGKSWRSELTSLLGQDLQFGADSTFVPAEYRQAIAFIKNVLSIIPEVEKMHDELCEMLETCSLPQIDNSPATTALIGKFRSLEELISQEPLRSREEAFQSMSYCLPGGAIGSLAYKVLRDLGDVYLKLVALSEVAPVIWACLDSVKLPVAFPRWASCHSVPLYGYEISTAVNGMFSQKIAPSIAVMLLSAGMSTCSLAVSPAIRDLLISGLGLWNMQAGAVSSSEEVKSWRAAYCKVQPIENPLLAGVASQLDSKLPAGELVNG